MTFDESSKYWVKLFYTTRTFFEHPEVCWCLIASIRFWDPLQRIRTFQGWELIKSCWKDIKKVLNIHRYRKGYEYHRHAFVQSNLTLQNCTGFYTSRRVLGCSNACILVLSLTQATHYCIIGLTGMNAGPFIVFNKNPAHSFEGRQATQKSFLSIPLRIVLEDVPEDTQW